MEMTYIKHGKRMANKTIPPVIDIIQKTRKRKILDKPSTKVPQRKAMPVIGHLTDRVKVLDAAVMATADEMEPNARRIWKESDKRGETSMLERCQ